MPRLLNRFAQQLEDLQAAMAQAANLHDQAVKEHEQAVEELRRQLELYRRYVFGPRRERVVEAPGQGHLFELDATEGVRRFLSHLSVISDQKHDHASHASSTTIACLKCRIEHDVPEADKVCAHCGELKARIGEDAARVLEFVPAHFELHVHVLPKYACSHCRDGVVSPPPPPRPVERLYRRARDPCSAGRLQVRRAHAALPVRGHFDSLGAVPAPQHTL